MSNRPKMSEEALVGFVVLLCLVPYVGVVIKGLKVVYEKFGWVMIAPYLGGSIVTGLLVCCMGLAICELVLRGEK